MNDTQSINGIQHCGDCGAELTFYYAWNYNSVTYRDRYSFHCGGCGWNWNGSTDEALAHLNAGGKKIEGAHILTVNERIAAQMGEISLCWQRIEQEKKQINKVLGEILEDTTTI